MNEIVAGFSSQTDITSDLIVIEFSWYFIELWFVVDVYFTAHYIKTAYYCYSEQRLTFNLNYLPKYNYDIFSMQNK